MSPRISNIHKLRAQIIFYVIVFFFLLLILNLFKVQIVDGKHYKEIAFKQHLSHIPVAGLRGKILDRNGEILAISLHPYSIGVNPRMLNLPPEEVAKKLSEILFLSEEEILEKITYRGATFLWVDRKVSDEAAKRVRSLNIDGIYVVKEETGKRFYPNHNLACHLLGYTGIDDQGLDGLEGVYEHNLSGQSGILKIESDNFGRAIPGGEREVEPAKDGDTVILTIDKFIQYVAEAELKKAMEKNKARSGTIIVMDPQTGAIYAIANYPDFDINEVTDTPAANLRNKAVCDSYEPGSTFKVIMAAAALDSGKITMDEMFPCGQCVQVGGWTINNASDGLYSETGYENVKDIIKYSFNTGSASIGAKMGKETYYEYIRKFGFGEITDIPLPGEAEGIVIHPDNWSISSLATISFGQGIAVTPLQLIRAVAAIANGGKLMKPMLVEKIINSEGQVVKEYKPEVIREVLKPETCKNMTEILKEVVADGTGTKAQVPGYTVAGKTGTAQLVENGVYSSSKFIPSFIGFVPADDPKLIILIKVDAPDGIYWGGYVAGPVFRAVAREALMHLGVPSESEFCDNISVEGN